MREDDLYFGITTYICHLFHSNGALNCILSLAHNAYFVMGNSFI